MDDAKGYLYAISRNANKLYTLRKSDMSVVRENFIGSKPTDIHLFQGNLYIALWGSTQVAVVNPQTGEVKQRLSLLTNPYSIEIDAKHLYYIGQDQWEPLYTYDLSADVSTEVHGSGTNETFYAPDLALDREKGLLYVGESGSSGSKVYEFDTATMKALNNNNAPDYGNSDRHVVRFGEDVYFAGYRFQERNVVNTVKTEKYGRTVLYADGPFVFTENKIMDRLTHETLVMFPFEVGLATMDANGYAYVTNKDTGKIYKLSVRNPEHLYGYLPYDLQTSFAHEALLDFVDADLLKGYAESQVRFAVRPNNNITRAEFVTLLVRSLGLSTNGAGKAFADVPKTEWYAEPVRIASALGMTDGVDASHFAPDRPINRDEAAAFIVKSFGSTLPAGNTASHFIDVPSYWATSYIAKASQTGVINGYADGTFKPANTITRAETVTMLSRALNKQNTALPSDDLLVNTAVQNELEAYRTQRAGDFAAARSENDKYATGYAYALGDFVIGTFEDLAARNFSINVDMIGTLSGTVVSKSNSFAVVKLSGAAYQIIKSRGDYQQSFHQEIDPLVYLKKVPGTTTWKVYRTSAIN